MHSRKDRLTFSCGGITSSGGACSDCQGLCMPEKMCNRGWPADVHSMQLSLSTERTRREILQLKPFSWIDPLTCWNSCSRVLHWSLKVRGSGYTTHSHDATISSPDSQLHLQGEPLIDRGVQISNIHINPKQN